MRKLLVFSSFWITLFAIFFMTLDHTGLLLQVLYQENETVLIVARVLRTFGRFALPLFAFNIVEGVKHTSSFKKYILRISSLALIVSVFFIVLEYAHISPTGNHLLRAGNIYLDLALLAFAIWAIKHENKWMRLLTLLPLAFSILSFIVKCVETESNIDILWFPSFLTMQYDWFTIVLGIGFYFTTYIADSYISMMQDKTGMDKSIWEANENYQILTNILCVFVLFVVSVFHYLFIYMWPGGVFWDAGTQFYAIFSGAFILLYSGLKGYNAKWFQIGTYLYYPLHIVVLILVYVIVTGGL